MLDPVDGTKAFIAGLPVFGILIALARDGPPVLGLIDHPATSERWLGGAGPAAPLTIRSGSRLLSAGDRAIHAQALDREQIRVGDIKPWAPITE